MKRLVIAVAAVCLLASTAAHARPQFKEGGAVSCDHRYLWTCDKRGWEKAKKAVPFRRDRGRVHRGADRTRAKAAVAAAPQPERFVRVSAAAEILPHPAGCPRRAFCGCGAALKVFGQPIRSLWVAANWFRFPRTEPAPGMVAVRNHHVFVIEAVTGQRDRRGHLIVIAYDANSGRHLTRRHMRSLAGYSVRNPLGAKS